MGGLSAGAIGAIGAGAGILGGLGASRSLSKGRAAASNILNSYRPTGFTSPGLSGSYADGKYSLTRGAPLTGALAGLGSAYTGAAADFRGLQEGFSTGMTGLSGQLAGVGSEFNKLRDQVSPAFGALTAAGMKRLGSARERAVGNLRDNLSRRRVLGSSFGEAAISQAEAEFGMQEAQFAADAKLQEIMANAGLLEKGQGNIMQQAALDLQKIEESRVLLSQANEAEIGNFQTQLQQLNLESDLAAKLSSGLSEIMAKNTQLNTQLTGEFQALRAGLWASVQKAGLSIGGAVAGKFLTG